MSVVGPTHDIGTKKQISLSSICARVHTKLVGLLERKDFLKQLDVRNDGGGHRLVGFQLLFRSLAVGQAGEWESPLPVPSACGISRDIQNMISGCAVTLVPRQN